MKNMGSPDRVIRLIVAAALVVSLVVLRPATHWLVLGIVAVGVLMITAFSATCPAYLPFGLSTKRR